MVPIMWRMDVSSCAAAAYRVDCHSKYFKRTLGELEVSFRIAVIKGVEFRYINDGMRWASLSNQQSYRLKRALKRDDIELNKEVLLLDGKRLPSNRLVI